MSTRKAFAILSASVILTFVARQAPAEAGELRTTAAGRAVVRQLSYHAPPVAEDTVTRPSAQMQPVPETPLAGPDFADDCWDGSCGGRYFLPYAGACDYWVSFEFLLWWRSGDELPPLVTTSPVGTPVDTAGVMGLSTTNVLYSNETLGDDARPGGRLNFGVWLDDCHWSGVGARLYSLGDTSADYDATSDDVAIQARPFYNVSLGQADADVVTYPGISTGSIAIRNESRVGGGDVFYRRLFFQDECHRVDILAGYQYGRVDQDLLIRTVRTSTATGGSIPLGTVIDLFDQFESENTYNAGAIGMMLDYDRGPVTWHLLAKLGLGNMRERVSIAGGTTTTVPGQGTSVTSQGLLALNTNSGSYERDVFTVSPEIALNMAYHLNDCVDVTVGYTFLYWNHVAQAGNQIDPALNTTQLTGPLVGAASPVFAFRDTDFLVHGLSLGLQCSW